MRPPYTEAVAAPVKLDSCALVVEDHGQNERRHDAGDDPGSNIAEKLKHGYFLRWTDCLLTRDLLQPRLRCEQLHMKRQRELLDAYAHLQQPGLTILPDTTNLAPQVRFGANTTTYSAHLNQPPNRWGRLLQ